MFGKYFKEMEKYLSMFILAAALLLVAGGVVLSMRSAGQMAETVKRQFNEEQLVVARNVANLVERELQVIKKEMSIISREINPGAFQPQTLNKDIQKTFSRVMELGVQHMGIIETKTHKIYTYMPKQPWTVNSIPGHRLEKYLLRENKNRENIYITHPLVKYTQISLELSLYLPGNFPKVLVVDLNLSWFLTPLLREARSGETGYAWVIDEKGKFLYHPETDFIGQSAFEIRQVKNSAISFEKINFIQKEKMLMGQKGTGSYISGWHRGETGRIEKLIAFHPIAIAEIPSQQWFVAVVAPVSEVAGALKRGYKNQLFLQGLIIATIVLAATTLIFIEKRWTKILEGKVSERTEELKRSEEKYRSLVESAEDFIFTVDETGKLLTMNSFTAKFFGGRKNDFLGKDLSALFSELAAEKQMKHIDHVYRFGKSIRSEIDLSMGPHQFWMNANFMPLKNDKKNVNAVLCIARDITENKNLEKRLINTEKLASLGTLAAGVAHEINNPLGVILGFCDLLLEKSDRHSRTYDDLKIIERQGLHCKEIVENLLSFSRPDSNGLETLDLNHCLKDLFQVVGHTLEMNRIVLETELAPGIPKVEVDPRHLQQVFLNVINNAVAAMDADGILRIETGFDRAGHKVWVRISDNGRGIEPENMYRIYEPFFTTKPEGEGTGLGLFVSYGIINRLGGSMTCVSRTAGGVDRAGGSPGTTFTISLPV